MRVILTALMLTLLLGILPASAGGRSFGHDGHGFGGGYHNFQRHRDWSDGFRRDYPRRWRDARGGWRDRGHDFGHSWRDSDRRFDDRRDWDGRGRWNDRRYEWRDRNGWW